MQPPDRVIHSYVYVAERPLQPLLSGRDGLDVRSLRCGRAGLSRPVRRDVVVIGTEASR